ncbi:alpha/beta hydrolase [Aestuariimicrobium ganziense]|uniref:alpha/beta hydrolase n=1 Tax=Aestuariimicrobium ganziense TaxID=2773677 RepID=UPI0019446C41|nr:alpha/beta hydrolase [Aestuariimicrobium ganziense]
MTPPFTPTTRIDEVTAHPALAGFGHLLFPTTFGSTRGLTLAETDHLLPYHSHVEPSTTLRVLHHLVDLVEAGHQVFHPLYTADEVRADPSRAGAGLFHLPGAPGAPFAAINAGGGFHYVGTIHESLPHALELSSRGVHGFAVHYRTGGAEVGCTDLARALSLIVRHATEWQVGTGGYSLWGGSAGGRVAALVGSRGAGSFGGDELPSPAAVVTQYTGHSDVSGHQPATWAHVGEHDGIVDWRVMRRRIDTLASRGIDTEFHLLPRLGHGFGLGVGTSAEGWIDQAVDFWDRAAQR